MEVNLDKEDLYNLINGVDFGENIFKNNPELKEVTDHCFYKGWSFSYEYLHSLTNEQLFELYKKIK